MLVLQVNGEIRRKGAEGFIDLVCSLVGFVMGTGFQIFCQVEITIILLKHDTPIRLHIKRPKSYNLSTTALIIINYVTIRLTSPRRLIPVCETKNTNKNLKEATRLK